MTIHEINGSISPVGPYKEKKVKEEREDRTTTKDSVELSSEARSLFEAERAKKMETIRQRIESGFYYRPEVTEKIVDSILADLAGASKR